MLPKTSAYVNYYDGQTKWMHFLIEDHNLLKIYNTDWNKVRADIKDTNRELFHSQIKLELLRKV